VKAGATANQEVRAQLIERAPAASVCELESADCWDGYHFHRQGVRSADAGLEEGLLQGKRQLVGCGMLRV
jgi:hypothetical protein